MEQKSLYELWLETTAETFGGYTQHDDTDYTIGAVILLVVAVFVVFLFVIFH